MADAVDLVGAVAVLLEKYEIVRDMFRPDAADGFDYRPALAPDATPGQRLSIMAGAVEWVLSTQQADTAKEQSEEGKKPPLQSKLCRLILSSSKRTGIAIPKRVLTFVLKRRGYSWQKSESTKNDRAFIA